jgi:hypothetical protein
VRARAARSTRRSWSRRSEARHAAVRGDAGGRWPRCGGGQMGRGRRVAAGRRFGDPLEVGADARTRMRLARRLDGGPSARQSPTPLSWVADGSAVEREVSPAALAAATVDRARVVTRPPQHPMPCQRQRGRTTTRPGRTSGDSRRAASLPAGMPPGGGGAPGLRPRGAPVEARSPSSRADRVRELPFEIAEKLGRTGAAAGTPPKLRLPRRRRRRSLGTSPRGSGHEPPAAARSR